MKNILTPPPANNTPPPTRAQSAAARIAQLVRSDFSRAKSNYIRLHKELFAGRAPTADLLAALGDSAGSVIQYGQQLGAAIDQQMPGTTKAMPITARIKPVTVNPDGTAVLTR